MAWLGGGSAGKCHTPARSRVITSRRSAREAGVVSRRAFAFATTASHNNSKGRSSPCSLAAGPHEIALLSSSVRSKVTQATIQLRKKKQESNFFFSEILSALTALHGTALEESNGMKTTAREAGTHLGHLNKSIFNSLYSRGSQNR